jgi:hypothetical protein
MSPANNYTLNRTTFTYIYFILLSLLPYVKDP